VPMRVISSSEAAPRSRAVLRLLQADKETRDKLPELIRLERPVTVIGEHRLTLKESRVKRPASGSWFSTRWGLMGQDGARMWT
jgi:hypothetical protein